MVCLGNICRSPLAEGVLKKLAEDNAMGWKVDSAGTLGYHAGSAPHPLSQKVAKLHGVDISCQVARQFVAEDFVEYDLIVPMAADVIRDMKMIAGQLFDPQKVKLLLEWSHPGKNMDVPDPWTDAEERYHEVYALIKAACEEIIKEHKQSA
ncbi:MAG: low molecular weight phosphotyrosine protein phosphatase [Chitinophagaceae bacterium]|nr:MAG: low molecular weight phosphotyrosine protein phosphatase [Chitinophagaceae bacterium]